MVSLGKQAYCTELVAEKITCSGEVRSANKAIGTDPKNLGQVHHNDSVLFFKYNQVHQSSSLTTTAFSSTVLVATTAAHGLLVGDTVHIGAIPANPGPVTSINGLLVSSVVGERVITSVPSTTTFTFAASMAAVGDGVAAGVVPLIRVDRYISTDLAVASDQAVVWARGTSLPQVPSHTNTELFYS